MNPEKYRVYAKIIGYVLSAKDEVHLYDCVIKKMPIKEQERRKFKAIEADIIRNPGDPRYHKSYITCKIFTDPRFIKTQYVIYCDLEVHDENAALGAAVRLFDRVCGSLALTTSSWFNNKHSRNDYKNYEYQLCRVYKLSEDGSETPINNLRINGGAWSMICNPGNTNFEDLDFNMLARMLYCRDEIFNKSFKYLLQAEKDYYIHVPPQMLTINLFKCIELIVCSFAGKKFPGKLRKAAAELSLTQDDIEQIKKLKEARDNGDVAHPRKGSRSDFYPPQFPVPEDVDFPNFWYSGLTSKVLLRYFLYVDSLITVKIARDENNHPDEIISVNYGKYYEIYPTTQGRKKVVLLLKKKLSKYFSVPYANIRLRKYNLSELIFQIKDHLKFNLNTSKSGSRHKFIIFPFS